MISRCLSLFIFLNCLFGASLVWANSSQALYQTCTACHGEKGQGNKALNAPSLIGQQPWYIESQLKAFKSQLRGEHPDDELGKQMLAVVSPLTTKEISLLAQYISEFEPKNNDKSLVKTGKGFSAYQARCGACHGSDGKGNDAFKAPNLTQLSPEYIQRQMDNFVQGKRGYKMSDKLGRQMAMMAKSVPDKELRLILAFLNQPAD